MPERDLIALTARLKGVTESIEAVMKNSPSQYQVGAQESFWIGELETHSHLSVTATLRYIVPHLYMWVEDGLEVKEEALEVSAKEFEERIYPTIHRLFGSEWSPGVDNDPRIHILNARLSKNILGYYSTADEYSRLVNPFSNQREIFYMNLSYLEPGTDYYHAVLTHELQHMVHWNLDKNEDSWVNEGLSELATKLAGYGTGQARIAPFLISPDTQLNAWAEETEEAIPHYAAAFLFMEYFKDRFGEDHVKELANQKANGFTGFDEVLAEHSADLTFQDIFKDWLVANYLDSPWLEEGRYGYQDLHVGVSLDRIHYIYPAHYADTVHQYAADYIGLRPLGASMRVWFDGADTVKLVGNDPHSGRYQWWSNRGDVSDTTLTRSFDLSGLEKATLSCWLWYDLEEDYDYAYIEISTDGGKTWHTLPSRYTTTTNPAGNNFGHGYTGKSGGEETPQWVEERIDLTPYVGGEVLLRFEMVTDDSYNGPGLCIDDIAIPELGYSYNAEDEGEWSAAGFVHTDNMLPQRFSVQLIEFGEKTIVREMQLSNEQAGELAIEGYDNKADQAVLIIAAMTPATTETASYAYTVGW